MSRIYLSPPDVGPVERELILDAFDSNWIAPLGPHVDAFEAELAAFVGVDHAVALSSGTAGLHLALAMVGVGPGDDVIVPSLTFAATAYAVVYLGARPCFVDSETISWNLDPDLLDEELAERAATNRLPAAVVERRPLRPVRRLRPHRRGVRALRGAADRGRGRGARRHVPRSSGGDVRRCRRVLVQRQQDHHHQRRRHAGRRDPELVAAGAVPLATQARDPAPHYEHSEIGYNYRMTQPARGRRPRSAARPPRARSPAAGEIFARYRDAFADVPGLADRCPSPTGVHPTGGSPSSRSTPSSAPPPPTVCRAPRDPRHRGPARVEAAAPPARVRGVADAGRCRRRAVFRDGLCLPSGSALTDADVDRVATIVRDLVTP